MFHRFFLAALALALLTGAVSASSGNRPNVVLILIDDHAANVTELAEPGRVRTPNMARLAARGTWFDHAYNPAPVCAASRASFLTGVEPARSGVYYNSQAYRRTDTFIARATTLPAHFRQHGYVVAGFGKINHTGYQEDNVDDFTPGLFKGHGNQRYVTNRDQELLQHALPGTVREIEGLGAITIAQLPDDWDRDDPAKWQQDTQQAARAVEFLGGDHARPFFLTVGFWRPHSQRIVPKRYYDLYPLDSIRLPSGYQPGDLEDVPGPGRYLATRNMMHAKIVSAGLWREHLQAYLAAVTYIDEQIGKVLDAIERSPNRANTIVVLASDNGFDLGEKDKWSKYAIWEQTCRVVFSFAGPGVARRRLPAPVGLIDLYPTLLNLCGLPMPATHELDGVDLTPLLRGEKAERGRPVLSTYGVGNFSLRDDRYRYIRYRNGDEELYAMQADPHAWTNLAGDPAMRPVMDDLARHFPATSAPEIPPAFRWDGSEMKADVFERLQPVWDRTFPRPQP